MRFAPAAPFAARLFGAALLFSGCANDIGLAKQAVCDGVLQQGEGTPDAPFDADGDGRFDAGNPDCAATYAPQFLDCDDDEAAIPGDAEVACNGVDDDCDAATPDGDDVDDDGFDACTDCADAIPGVNPGAVEVACNDLDDDCDAATLDGEDGDGDGVTACADCDDGDPEIGPLAAEVACNGVDDDCDATTPDGDDLDGDGWLLCDDCDDTSADAHPGATEICDNGADDDCNGDVDDGCISDYSGTWDLGAAVTYTCAWGNVNIDFDRVLVTDTSPSIAVDALGSGTQPGEMTGSFTGASDFTVSQTLRGTCNETYTLEASFTSMTSFEGTFTARYSGSLCLDCTNQTWTVTGTR